MKHAISMKLLPAALLVSAAAIGVLYSDAVAAPGASAAGRQITDLPEVVVESRQKPVLYLTGYVREYAALTCFSDTVFLFREKLVDFMIPGKHTGNYKGWRIPRLLSTRSYYRFTNDYGLDSVSNHYREHFSWSDWIGILNHTPIPLSMRSLEAVEDTVYGQYSPAQIWRRLDSDMQLEINVLADTTNRQWIPGITPMMRSGITFDKIMVQYDFAAIGSTEVLADNISKISYAIEANGKNRDRYRLGSGNIPRYMDTYAEIYIIDRCYMSVKEARRLEKNPPRNDETTIMAPVDAPELPQGICDLMSRVDGIDYSRLRLNYKLDNRLANLRDRKPTRIQSLKKKASRILKSLLE